MKEGYQPTPEDMLRIAPDPEQLKVSGDGIFYTLQGEGTTMGKPAVFLRLHYCNLHCSWCDTPYTWNKKMPEYWQEPRNAKPADLKFQVEDAWGAKADDVQKRLVVTGGEPLLQQKKLVRLFTMMPEWNFEIETNGTIAPEPELVKLADEGVLQFNCSPKLENSGNLRASRIRPEALQVLKDTNTIFKFVVTSPADLDEIETDYLKANGIPKEKVVLMPEGVTPEALHEHALLVSEYAKEKGYRMLGRMQIDVWGQKRRT